MHRLKPDVLRKVEPSGEELAKIIRNPIYLVLDNVLDTYNIGSLFRLADAVGVQKVILCGNMEYPPSSRIHKAAVGTENWVPWEKRDTTLEVIRELKDKRSIPYTDLKPNFPIAIVVGHETTGISTEILNEVDKIVELPMQGINHSFNVWGSAAVVLYKILESL